MQTIRSAIDECPAPPDPNAEPGEAAVESTAIMCRLVDMASIEHEWRRLERLPLNSLHQGYDWCRSWSIAHGRTPLVIEGLVGDRMVFLLPLEIARRNGIRVAAFPGGRHNNLNTGLFAEDFRPAPARQMEIRRQIALLLKGKADLAILEAVPRRWRDGDHPLAALCFRTHLNPSFQLPLHPRFEETLKQLNAKRRRKKFRTQNRRLEEAGGYDHWIPETLAEQHTLLDLFFRQKRVRFEAHGLPDVFADPEIRAFFHALIDAQSMEQNYPLRLHAIRLRKGGEIAAIAGLSRKGDHIICQFGSIDGTLHPEASPGELLFWLMIEQACAQGAALFDFGVGDQGYKRSWCPVETVLYDISIPISTAGRIAAALHAGIGRAKLGIKRNPRLYRMIQRLRAGRRSPLPTEQD
ncbi:GNAT family N-acetyltransferase [Rhizobium sp. SAFR-030]|uniref:GNAT family N-acetyltransferase n=1 Tax=Rhizobium sp. SAFR-030 TaxID=3387277 RepID=UPI003F7EBCCC